MISLYILGGLFYTFAGFSYSLFAIIDISRVKENKSKYTEEEYKKERRYNNIECAGGICGVISGICFFLL